MFYATEQTKLYRNIGIVSMGIGVLVTVLLVYVFDLGALGLALKMVLSQFIGVTLQLLYNSRFLSLKLGAFLWHQFYAFLFFAAWAGVSTYMVAFQTPLVNFLISGLLYTIFAIIGFLIYPQLFAITRDELSQSIKRMKRVIEK